MDRAVTDHADKPLAVASAVDVGRDPTPEETRRVLVACVERMAADVARLRRRCDPDTGLYWVGERLASELEVVDTCLWPSAGQLVKWTYPGDDQAVDEALAIVEGRQRALWSLMGGRPRV